MNPNFPDGLLVKSKNALYVSFHSQVRSGARIPEDNDWDKGRSAAESTVHPNYYENINYTALSLDGFGVLWWGDLDCTRFRRHRVRCFHGTGGGSWRGGSSHESSSL